MEIRGSNRVDVTIRLEFDLSKRRNDEQLSTKLRYGEAEATAISANTLYAGRLIRSTEARS